MKTVFNLLFLLVSIFGLAHEKFDAAVAEKFQKDINLEYADAKTSPLMAEDVAELSTLDFYRPTEKYNVVAKLTRTAKEKAFEMKTSTDRKPLYVKYGEVQFAIDGQAVKLYGYRKIELSKKPEYKDYLFLPFSDLSSGNESYSGGKYIDLKMPKGKKIASDFNTSYTPYCAYNSKYSCPKVALENDLNIEIRAGLKKLHK